MSDVCVECGGPMEEDNQEFWAKSDAVHQALMGLNIGQMLDLLSMHAGMVIGCLEPENRPLALIDFISDVSHEVAHIDDEPDVPDGSTIQ